MVPMQMGALEHDVGNDAEDGQRDAFLDDFQLDEVERSSVLDESDAVGWHLTTILEESNHPREGYDADEWPVAGDSVLL